MVAHLVRQLENFQIISCSIKMQVFKLFTFFMSRKSKKIIHQFPFEVQYRNDEKFEEKFSELTMYDLDEILRKLKEASAYFKNADYQKENYD